MRSKVSPQSRRALYVLYSHYPTDPRPQRQARALREAGWEVTVLGLNANGEPTTQDVGGVRVHSLRLQRYRGQSPIRYIRSYGRFLGWALGYVSRHPREYDVIHVHTPPDFAVFAALPAKWFGSGVLLDIHDLSPELFEDRFSERRQLALRVVQTSERVSTLVAHHVLTTSHEFRERLKVRSVPADKVSISLNLPDESIFWRDDPPSPPASPVLAYHGTLVPRCGPDLLLEAGARLVGSFPDLTIKILGDGDQRAQLIERASRPDLRGRVEFSEGRIPTTEIPTALGAVSAGVVAQRPLGFGGLGLPTKLLEYIALGIPAVVTRTPVLDHYFEPDELITVESADPSALASVLERILAEPSRALMHVERSRRFFLRHTWASERAKYVQLMDRLALR